MQPQYVPRDWNRAFRQLDTLVILGASGGAREVVWQLLEIHPSLDFVFVDDITDIHEVDMAGRKYPVVKDWRFERVRAGRTDRSGEPFSRFLIGLGNPRDKHTMVQRALSAGLAPAPTPVHPTVIIGDDCELGVGGFIMARCIVTTYVRVGDYVLLQATTVGYNTQIGDYSSCYPGAGISSESGMGEGSLLGAGAIIRDGRRIGDWVTVGGQAFVASDVLEEGSVVAGVPARRLS